MVEAVVEYDYTAQESDELTIRKGDVIREIIKKSGGWWEGTLRDKRGMFPDNFVTVIHKESKVALRAKNSRLRQCRAIFSYHPAHEDELNLAVGDVIDVVSEVEEGWWKGRLGGVEGVFPSNFVVEIEVGKSQPNSASREDLPSLADETDPSIPNLPPKPTRIMCRVKYPYEACNDDELTLREGDVIALVSKDGQDRGWWRGELHGRIGVFPDNFVVVLPVHDHNGTQAEKQDKKTDKCAPIIDEDRASNTKIASQRKSLELKSDEHKMPPLPGKKPNLPKKFPAATGMMGTTGLKQRFVDMLDGGAVSRAKEAGVGDGDSDQEFEFDQVERSAMLSDMRANRAKGPGRRPPSAVYRDNESGLVNGNSDHIQLSTTIETSTTTDDDDSDRKPKIREWEKHKAPWVEELKMNQARRTPPLTPAADNARLKLTPTDKSLSPSDADSTASTDKEFSSTDLTKSMAALSLKLRTLPSDVSVVTRSKMGTPLSSSTPARPQSIHGVMVTTLSEPPKSTSQSLSQSPSPVSKPPVADKITANSPRTSVDKKSELVSMKQYLELQERLAQLELRTNQQVAELQADVESLRSRLQIESELRRSLQAELEKVAQCVTQV